jgi:hypothetical protein
MQRWERRLVTSVELRVLPTTTSHSTSYCNIWHVLCSKQYTMGDPGTMHCTGQINTSDIRDIVMGKQLVISVVRLMLQGLMTSASQSARCRGLISAANNIQCGGPRHNALRGPDTRNRESGYGAGRSSCEQCGEVGVHRHSQLTHNEGLRSVHGDCIIASTSDGHVIAALVFDPYLTPTWMCIHFAALLFPIPKTVVYRHS